MSVAVSAIGDFLLEHDMLVYLVIYDGEAFALGEKLQASIQAFIDDRYVHAHDLPRGSSAKIERRLQRASAMREAEAENGTYGAAEDMAFDEAKLLMDDTADLAPCISAVRESETDSLARAVSKVGESFSERLFRLIDERGLTDPQVYKRANLDRKLFSKIRTKPDYRPGKNTVLALCIALRLSLEQTEDLLRRAGLALSPGSKADLIVEYFIQHRNYDVYEINEALFAFDQELLGTKM